MLGIRTLLCHVTLCLPLVSSRVILTQTTTEKGFKLTCTVDGYYKSWTIDWYRGPYGYYALRTEFWSNSIHITELGEDLRNRTLAYITPTQHQIEVKIDKRGMNAYWICCRYYYDYNYNVLFECSDNVFVKGNPDSGKEVVTMMSPAPPTDVPEVGQMFNGTLIMMTSQDQPTEGQHMTLTCTISTEIMEDNWFVVWFRNDTPVMVTFSNSTIISGQILRDKLSPFLNTTEKDDRIWQSFDYMFQNISANSNSFQQNVTIPVMSSLIGVSYWKCFNPFVANFSNTVITVAMSQPSTEVTSEVSKITMTAAEETVTSDLPKITITDAKETVTSGLPKTITPGGQTGGESSKTTYIVVGSICAVVVVIIIIFIIIIIIIVFKKTRKREFDAVDAKNKSLRETVKEDMGEHYHTVTDFR